MLEKWETVAEESPSPIYDYPLSYSFYVESHNMIVLKLGVELGDFIKDSPLFLS